MKRTLPLLITACSGFILIAAFFIPVAQPSGEAAAIWFDLLAAIAFLLGGGNLLKQHLKRVSDQRKGWGYSAIIVGTFLITLFFGLTKWGSRPFGKTEFLGESFVACPLELLPETSVVGSIPSRADGEHLPISVRRQMRSADGNIYFRGWMTGSQLEDLFKYQDSLEWRATAEELHEQSQAPSELSGKFRYLADQGVLAFKGYMTPENEQALQTVLAPIDNGAELASQLATAARVEHSIEVPVVPAGVIIPVSARNRVLLEGNKLTVVGPLEESLTSQLANDWTNLKRMRSPDAAARQELRARIEAAGIPLNEAQVSAFESSLNTLIVQPEVLVLLLNAAGVAEEGEYTYRELYAQYLSGERFLKREIPATEPNISLNPAQEAIVAAFLQDERLTVEAFKTELQAAGPTSPRMLAKIDSFYSGLPAEPVFLRELCLSLLKAGDLTTAQRELLVKPYRDDYLWRRTIGRLAVQAHQTKYRWSGEYDQNGTPFWWLYQYIFQPLLTTTFAVLAFYVASAAFRAFRAKNVEASLLLGTAFLILLRPTFLGPLYSSLVPEFLSMDNMTSFIMGTMNTAGNRAIMIGIALGIASTSLKVLLGIDRSYLGSSDD